MKSINGGGTNPEYTYNAEGRRVRKKAGGTTTEYVYDLGGSAVAEFVVSLPKTPFERSRPK